MQDSSAISTEIALFSCPTEAERMRICAVMPTKDKRIDAYIAKSADFAKPILTYLRSIVHEGCPECTETLKWSMPAFGYKGIVCMMAAFKAHCAFHIWKAQLVVPEADRVQKDSMGVFGRITSVKDLPPRKTLLGYIRKAKQLNEAGVKIARPKPQKNRNITAPPYMMSAIKKNKKALTTWEAFPYSKKKDYVDWVTEAKTDETRNKRLATTIEWLSEGKARNWKYENC